MTCQACGKPHPSVTVDRYGAPALCTWCYLKRPFPGVSIGGTVSSNDTLSSPPRERPENPDVPRELQNSGVSGAGTPVVEPNVPTSTSTIRTTSTRKEETPTLAETTSVGGATETREATKTRSGSEFFRDLETDAVKFGAKPVEMVLPDDLSPAAARVANDVAYVLGIYEVLDGVGVPQPYSQRFGAERLGLSHMTIRRALAELVRRGVLTDCGETDPHRHYPRGTKLWRRRS